MSGHSSRWWYQMGPVSEPHLQQAPLTLTATSPLATWTLRPTPPQGWNWGIREGFGVRIKKRLGGYELGVSDQCWMAAFKAPWIQDSLPGPWSPRSWFCYYTPCSCDGQMAQRHGHMHSHAFNTRRAPTHQWTQPDTPLSCLIRRL